MYFIRFTYSHSIWHWSNDSQEGSEHTISNKRFPMEQQLFHYNTKYPDYSTASTYPDGVAAVSFFYEISATNNTALDPLISAIRGLECNPNKQSPILGLDTLEFLLPQDEGYPPSTFF